MKRRTFVQTSLAAMGAVAAAQAQALLDGPKRRVGLIGAGWYGKVDLLRLIQVAPVEVVSMCDVDSKMLDGAADLVMQRLPNSTRPRLYRDYREMLAEKDLDLVLIGTPDHWHALQMIEAVRSGAHVYVQKPTSVDVVESHAMLAAARKYNRVVQVGTQRRSTPHLIEARDRIVREGLLGKVAHIDLCCYYHMRARDNPPDKPVPDHLDFDLWTGPAPLMPYNELIHPRKWRAFMEYGNGIVGDMCVHMLDMVRWVLDLGWPKRISSTGGIFVDRDSRANITDTQTATFEFDDVNAVWTHRTWGTAPDPQYPWAGIIYGEKGTLKLSVNSYDFIPIGSGDPIHGSVVMELDQFPEDQTEKDLEKHTAPAVRRHLLDWLAAIDRGGRPVADIEQGHISSVSCILANIAMQVGRTLNWCQDTHRVIDDHEANALLERPYRDPWKHPDASSV